jgi:hypothetical protein
MSSSWKTTLLGIAAGIIPILQTVVTSLQNNTSLNWGSIAFGALIMALGIVAKDFNITGGTSSNGQTVK